MGAGDDLPWRECDEGGGGLFGQIAQAEPGGAGDLVELFGFVELQIHEDEREVAVAQEEIGGLDGLGGLAAAHPEELLTEFAAGCSGIEGIAPIDQDDGALVGDGGVEDTGDEETATTGRDGAGTGDFGESATGDANSIEAGGTGFDGVTRRALGSLVGVRKLLAQAFAELQDVFGCFLITVQ